MDATNYPSIMGPTIAIDIPSFGSKDAAEDHLVALAKRKTSKIECTA